MRIYLEPQDVLFLRDGTPFGVVGAQHPAPSIFPPNPSTFYGALRAAIIQRNGLTFQAFSAGAIADAALRAVVGDPANFGSLAVTGIALVRRPREEAKVEWLLPAPADLVEDREAGQRRLLRPVSGTDEAGANFPHPRLEWPAPGGDWEATAPVRTAGGYLEGRNLEQYLCGETPAEMVNQENVVRREWRIGIGRERSKTTTEGRLFQMEYIRLREELGFLVEVQGEDGKLPGQGWLRLGGDGRAVTYRRVEKEMHYPMEAVAESVATRRQFRVVLLTPAVFKKGWLPDFVEAPTLEGSLAGLKVRLLSAALPHRRAISGWDIQKRYHKPLRYAVPAGAVYFCEILDANPDIQAWLSEPIKRLMPDNPEGFGLGIIGG
jgi:CRISPR-associated protein Cmr3